MNTFAVRNVAQKILFDEELSGQISDGRWENTRPYDHYKCWSDATVIVDPQNVGRDFGAIKDNYNLNESALLAIVGERMLQAVQQQIPSYTIKMMRRDLTDLKAIMKTWRSA